MKQLKSSAENLRSLFTNAIAVRHIAESLASLQSELLRLLSQTEPTDSQSSNDAVWVKLLTPFGDAHHTHDPSPYQWSGTPAPHPPRQPSRAKRGAPEGLQGQLLQRNGTRLT